jgi:hypothetical protein
MTSTFRHSSICAAALAIATMMAGPALAAPTVSVTGPSTVVPGSLLQLDVMAAGFSDLYAYQFDITFNPAAFAVTNVTEGSFLSTVGSTFFDGGQSDNTTGTVTFVIDSLIGPGSGATGGGSLAQLTFLALPAFSGNAYFSVDNVVALDSALNTLDVSTQGTTVSAVPEPSTLLLSLAGLGVVGVAASVRKDRRPVAA